MSTFIKAQIAAIVGSAADYMVTILLVNVFHCWYVLANFMGNITGGGVQFLLSRKWAFSATAGNFYWQILKFVFIFCGNLLLSAVGIYIFTHWFRLHYLLSKTIVSILLGTTYNYFLQKKFVFNSPTILKKVSDCQSSTQFTSQ